MRCRGLRGLGGFWRLADKEQRNDEDKVIGELRRRGKGLVKKCIQRYVKARANGTKSRLKRPSTFTAERACTEPTNPTTFRYTQPLPRQDERPSIVLEIPNFELWINELWHDFCIEPTPYLVASAILYLGGILILAQYYQAAWWLACFFFRFVPWDDELAWGYI